MKKIWGIFFLSIILFYQSAEAKQTKWKRGAIYEGEITWEKKAKIKLPPGKFKLMAENEKTFRDLVSRSSNLQHQFCG